MMKRRLVFGHDCLCGHLLLGGAVAKPKGDGPQGKPFVYKQSAGKERVMELCFPPGHDAAKDRVPGMILFHGGGWQGGETKELPPSESKKRVCITDAKSAIRWFKLHSLAFGMNPQRLVVGGARGRTSAPWRP